MSKKAQGRKFGLTVGIAFLALTGIVVWRDHMTVAYVTGSLGGLLVLGGLLIPSKLGPIERAWMAMAHKISKVTTPIVMGIVYFLVLAPIGFVVRTIKGNPLVRVEHNGSLWVVRADEKIKTGGMENQY